MAGEKAIDKYRSIEIFESEKWVFSSTGKKFSKPIPTKITRNGNSYCCRINPNIVKYLGFHLGDPVKIILIPGDEDSQE